MLNLYNIILQYVRVSFYINYCILQCLFPLKTHILQTLFRRCHLYVCQFWPWVLTSSASFLVSENQSRLLSWHGKHGNSITTIHQHLIMLISQFLDQDNPKYIHLHCTPRIWFILGSVLYNINLFKIALQHEVRDPVLWPNIHVAVLWDGKCVSGCHIPYHIFFRLRFWSSHRFLLFPLLRFLKISTGI